MGRPERPLDVSSGPVARFAQELRDLRASAGVTYRKLADACGFSVTTLAQAAGGERLASLPVVLAYAEACGGEPEVWERRWREVSAAVAAEAALGSPRDDEGDPPYRGLARFEPGDRELFFGRDELIAHLTEQVARRRVVAVTGASGSGKSSLLRAGLIPAVRQNGIAGQPPAAVRILTPGNRPATTHGAHLRPAPGPAETVVIIDQFEEVFTLTTDPRERSAFLDAVAATAADTGGPRVVIGVRADFLARLAQHPALAAALRDATVLVGPMEPAALRQVIVRPAAAAGLIVERALTARLVEEAAAEVGSLPLLSHVLLETWRRRHGRALTEAMYEAAGGIHGAISATAEAVYTGLSDRQAALAHSILLRLVTPGDGAPDTRRPTDRAELDAIAPQAGDVVEELLRARLLVSDGRTIGLAHEAVISAWPRYRGWIDHSREKLRHHRNLTDAAALWADLDHDPGALLRGSRLDTAVDAFLPSGGDTSATGAVGDLPDPEGVQLTSLERRFLTASRAAREREGRARLRTVRRMRTLTAALSVLLVLALLAAVTAVRQRTTADRARARAVVAQQVALSRQLAADSAAVAATDTDLSALLAVQAYRTQPTHEAETAVYAAAADPLRLRLHGGQAVTAEAFAPDGRTLCWSEGTWTVRCADTATGTVRALPPIAVATEVSQPAGSAFNNLPNITGLVFHDSRTLLTTDELGGVYTTDITTGRSRELLAEGRTPKDTRLSADGRTQAVAAPPAEADVKDGTAYGDPDITIRDVRTGRSRAVVHPTIAPRTNTMAADGHILSDVGSATLALSADGRLIATTTGWAKEGENTSRIRIWNTATGRPRTTMSPGTAPTAAAFSADGHELAVDDGDGIRIWNIATGTSTFVGSAVGGSSPVTALAFAPDGSALAAAGSNGAVSLVNMDTHRGRTLHAVTIGDTEADAVITQLGFSTDSRQLAAGDSEGGVRVFDTGTSHPYESVAAGRFQASGSVLADDGGLLAVPESDGGIRLIATRTGKDAGLLPGRGHPLRAVVAAPRGPWLAVQDESRLGTLTLWNLATRTHRALALPDAILDGIVFTPDGSHLTAELMLTSDKASRKARTWDTRTGRTIANELPFPTPVHRPQLVLSPDARTLAIGTGKVLFLVDARTGKTLHIVPTHDTALLRYGVLPPSFAFSPDSRTIADTRSDGYIQLLNVSTGKVRVAMAADSQAATAFAFSPDGRSLAVGDDGGTVRVWDLATAHVHATYDDGSGPVTLLAFSPDGSIMASGEASGRARLWHIYSPDPGHAIAQICRAVGRDFTADELGRYLPDHPATHACPS